MHDPLRLPARTSRRLAGACAATDAGWRDGIGYGAFLACTVDGDWLAGRWRRPTPGPHVAELWGALLLARAGVAVTYCDRVAVCAQVANTRWCRRTHPAIRFVDRLGRLATLPPAAQFTARLRAAPDVVALLAAPADTVHTT